MNDKSRRPRIVAGLLLAACLAGCSALPVDQPVLTEAPESDTPAACQQSQAEQRRQEQLIERQARQLRECQRKVQELQEKLDRLADIERSLPVRPGAVVPGSKP